MDNLYYNVFRKIFKTFDHKILDNCMFYLSRYEYFNRRIRFLTKLNKTVPEILLIWTGISGQKKLKDLYIRLNINSKSQTGIKRCIWSNFT